MTRTNTPWRPSEFERARHLREEGLSWREVGERLGRSEAAMHSMVGVLKEADWSARDVLEEELAASERTTVPKYTFKYWRPSELKLCREMRADGYTWTEIGERLGRRPGACESYVSRMDREAVMVEVTGRRNARYAALTEHERAIVDAKLNDGLGVRAIGEHVGRHWYVISTYKRVKGIGHTLARPLPGR